MIKAEENLDPVFKTTKKNDFKIEVMKLSFW